MNDQTDLRSLQMWNPEKDERLEEKEIWIKKKFKERERERERESVGEREREGGGER